MIHTHLSITKMDGNMYFCYLLKKAISFYASVKGNLELPLLKGRRRFDVETTSNLEVYIFRGW